MSYATSYMERALSLAWEALGTTSPNPSVGAVVVNDSNVVGEGYTLPPGQSHAEVRALEYAGVQAQGASLYVTLEPCCTQGRTPPCTGAIIAAGIREAHVATIDPNPRVNGKGLAELEAAGIKIYLEEHGHQAQELYESFTKHVRTSLPHVTAKFAMSLDGKIATHNGDSKWVTGGLARDRVQEMRRATDAVMVGVNTVFRDDPQLTARDGDGNPRSRQPLRVILDSAARTPTNARVFKEPGHTIVVTTAAGAGRVGLLADAGAEVLELAPTRDGMVDLRALLQSLGERGVVSVLVEGGGTLLGSLFDQGLVDKVAAFVAPVIIGGAEAPSPVGGHGAPGMAQALRLERVRVEQVGDDVLLIGYPPVRQPPEDRGSRAGGG